jgi:hypothetical protein
MSWPMWLLILLSIVLLGGSSWVVLNLNGWPAPCHSPPRRLPPDNAKIPPEDEMDTATGTCIHCDSVLSPTDISTGWCDSCGKRIPTSATPAAKKPATPQAVAASASGKGLAWAGWGLMALVVLAVGAASVFAFAR